MSISSLAIPFSLLVAGIYIGTTLIHIPYLELDKEVNIVELGNLITIPLLALLIPILLTRSLDNKKCAKELLINELKILCSSLEKIDCNVKQLSGRAPTPDEFRNILSDFKSSRIHLKFIKEQVEDLQCSQAKNLTQKLDDRITSYWSLVTGSNGIKVNNFTASPKFIWKQSVEHDMAARDARKLMFSINNH